MKQAIIIFHAKPWAMTDEITKAQRSGVSIQYAMTDTLTNYASDDIDHPEYGYSITKESISLETGKLLECVPGIYDAEFMLKASNGKNVLAIKNLKCVGPVIESAAKK